MNRNFAWFAGLTLRALVPAVVLSALMTETARAQAPSGTFTRVGGQTVTPKNSPTRRPAVARAPVNNVTHILASDIDSALARVQRSDLRGTSFTASKDQQTYYVLNVRSEPSAIELHCLYDDILLVRSGAGVLQHGTRILSPSKFLGYEWRGVRIDRAREDTLGVGDLLRVPAGEAHTIRNLGEAPLVYLVIKVRNLHGTACQEFPNAGK